MKRLTFNELKEGFFTWIDEPNRMDVLLYYITDREIILNFKVSFEFFCIIREKDLREYYNDQEAPVLKLLQRFHDEKLNERAVSCSSIKKVLYN